MRQAKAISVCSAFRLSGCADSRHQHGHCHKDPRRDQRCLGAVHNTEGRLYFTRYETGVQKFVEVSWDGTAANPIIESLQASITMSSDQFAGAKQYGVPHRRLLGLPHWRRQPHIHEHQSNPPDDLCFATCSNMRLHPSQPFRLEYQIGGFLRRDMSAPCSTTYCYALFGQTLGAGAAIHRMGIDFSLLG